MRRSVLLAVLLGVLAALLAACSRQAEPAPTIGDRLQGGERSMVVYRSPT